MRIIFYFKAKDIPNSEVRVGEVYIELTGKLGSKTRKKYINTGYACKLDTYKKVGENTVYWSQESKSFVANKKNRESSNLAANMNREIMRMITRVIDIQEQNQFASPDDLVDAYERTKTSETLSEVYNSIMIRKTLVPATARVYMSTYSWAMGAAVHLLKDTEPTLDAINSRAFATKLFDYVSGESPKYQWKIDPETNQWDLFQTPKKTFTFNTKKQVRGWYNLIINHAFENMLIPHKIFRLPIENQKEPGRVQKERLNSQELRRLIEYDYMPHLCPEIYQDVFTLCCLTGMSYVDVRKLKASEVIENKDTLWIEKPRSKTANTFVVYLIEPAKEIIYKYLNKESTKERGYLFWQLSENTMLINHHLKKFGKAFFSEFPRKKSLSSHVGRHTFTQIHAEIGTPNQVIADMMGWKMGTIVDTYRAIVRKNVYNSMESFWDYIREKKPTDEFDF